MWSERTERLVERVEGIVSPVYLVGGPVRDELLGLEAKDFDFATPILPDEVERLIRAAGRRPYRVGKRFGTLGLRVDGHLVEITTFRSDVYERYSRHPEVTYSTDLEDDLARRDFTVNAMARTPEGGLVDPFGGRDDLAARTIRTVGDPRERFSEDPLRLLRAARFAAQLDFRIEDETLTAMRDVADSILPVSRQRWTAEIDALLCSANPEIGLGYLADTGLLRWILPEVAVQLEYPDDSGRRTLFADTVGEVVRARAGLDEPRDSIEELWAALLSNVAVPYLPTDVEPSDPASPARFAAGMAERIGNGLRWSRLRVRGVGDLIEFAGLGPDVRGDDPRDDELGDEERRDHPEER